MAVAATPANRDEGSRDATPWAKQFFEAGFRDQPWVVLKRTWCSAAKFRRVITEARSKGGGWLFPAFRYQVLHAPTFHVWASDEQVADIIGAIEDYPRRRVEEFNAFERPQYERFGWPPHIIEMAAPQPGFELEAESFRWPVLVAVEDPVSKRLALLGAMATLDAQLPALVDSVDVTIDTAMALKILLTCHGDPGADYARTVFARPLHPNRRAHLRRLLSQRTDGADPEGELLRELVNAVPEVIESLRKRPPRRNTSVYRAARSRLAETVSRRIDPDHRPRRPLLRWWQHLVALSPRERGLYFRSLTPGERTELNRRLKGQAPTNRLSTSRVLLRRAKDKLRSMLRDGRTLRS